MNNTNQNNQPFPSFPLFENSFLSQSQEDLSFPSYSSLPLIPFGELLPLSQKISKVFSSPSSYPLSSQISSLNSLRSIFKSFPSFFFQIFISIKSKFIHNILNNESNLHIQLLSIKFLQELYSDETENFFPDDLNFDLFPILFKMFLKNENEMLKNESKKWIETFSMNNYSNSKYACLIRAMKGSSQETAAFIYECLRSAIEKNKGSFYLNFCLNDIMNYLVKEKENENNIFDIKENDKDYFIKIKEVFKLIKNNLDNENERESINGLSEKNKNIYLELIS